MPTVLALYKIVVGLPVPLTIILLLSLVPTTNAQTTSVAPPATRSIIRYDIIHHPTFGRGGMVASQRQVASDIGAKILAMGGNAVDAAVGVGFALAVALPRAGNLGGGGFMLIHLNDTNTTLTIDFRETAPLAAHKNLFLNVSGMVDEDARRSSHRSVGVPGSVAGLAYALENYGTLPLETVLQPAIRLAQNGIIYDYDLASAISSRADRLARNEHTKRTFFLPSGKQYAPGSVFKQPELAKTLTVLAKEGSRAFYEGTIAHQIVNEMQRGGGLITLADLKAYRPVVREPIRGTYSGYDIVSMPPPSSGGVHLVQILNVLEKFPMAQMGSGSADALHLLAETTKRAYADRSKHLGDPDFYPVPVDWLTSKEYASEIASEIDMQRARPSTDIAPGIVPLYESEDTTHYSVIDAQGNAVATTYTLNFSFGSGITVPGAGFLLNNEMADFSAKPGVPDAFGLLGGEANAVQAGKRPLSAMTPTMVLKDGKALLVTGSPGGSRIITAVTQHVINVLAHKMNVAEANHAPRIHHQWFPDTVFYESGINPDTLAILESRGHILKSSGTMGSVQAIYWDGERYQGTADPRRPGAGVAAANE